MTRSILRSTALLLVVWCFVPAAHAGVADLNGTTGWSVTGTTSEITADQIRNTTANVTSGTLYLTLWFTTSPDPYSPGFIGQRSGLQFVNGTGQLSPGASFTNVRVSDNFSRPPDGTYYSHVYTSQFPDLGTVLDIVTFGNTRTFGTPPPPSGGADTGNNTRSGATALPLNQLRDAAIDPAGDVDYWLITLPQSGTLTVESSGNTDTVGRLEYSDGSFLAEDDDGGLDLNFRIQASSLSAGNYYLKVTGFDNSDVGPYGLSASFTPNGSSGSGNGTGGGGSGNGNGGGGSTSESGGGGGSLSPLSIAALLALGCLGCLRRAKRLAAGP